MGLPIPFGMFGTVPWVRAYSVLDERAYGIVFPWALFMGGHMGPPLPDLAARPILQIISLGLEYGVDEMDRWRHRFPHVLSVKDFVQIPVDPVALREIG